MQTVVEEKENNLNKVCNKCLILKPIGDFSKRHQHRNERRNDCKSCHQRTSREWKYKNKQRVLEYNSQYRKENKTIVQNSMNNYIKNNPDRYRQLLKKYRVKNQQKIQKYRSDNIDYFNKQSSFRRACKKQAIPLWFGELDKLVLAEAFALTKDRFLQTGVKWHVDHIVPLQSEIVCGLHCADNMQVIPAIQNLNKSNRYWPAMPDREAA